MNAGEKQVTIDTDLFNAIMADTAQEEKGFYTKGSVSPA